MARVTVEDCLDHVENRFELVRLATRRARMMYRTNSEPMIDPEDDKPTVIALREIAMGLVSHEVLDEHDAATQDEEVEMTFGVTDEQQQSEEL